MNQERWRLIDRLFHEALKLTSSEREKFLSDACGADGQLRSEIQELISSHEESESFIETPAAGLATELLSKTKGSLAPGQSIGPYKILSVLGIGGMGEVYLAQDNRLGRNVALKLLPAQFTLSPERVRRFEQEARAASALNHPNIVTIHEIGETQGTKFIVTEFVEGQTLREVIGKGALSLAQALDITIQAAGALEAAHKAGIVHRDIKPENLMVRSDDYVKILDFGLAKLSERASLGADSALPTQMQVKTNPGMVMGTVQYMSPEQARGEVIDARTDVWSLGVVLYEMVTGRVPFEGKTTSHVIVSILENEPEFETHNVPAELQRILINALRKEPAHRYQSAKELEVDLKNLKQELEVGIRLKAVSSSGLTGSEVRGGIATGDSSPPKTVPTNESVIYSTSSAEYLFGEIKRHKRGLIVGVAALALIVAALIYTFSISRKGTVVPASLDTIDSVAVLPFVNESKDPNTEYLSDGISDSIINRLSKLSNLRVASLSSALRYKGQSIDAAMVGRDLKVRAVLIGWMTTRGNTLTIRTELVDVRDNRRLWGEQYNNRQLADLLQVQEDISQRISENLRLRLSGEDQQRLKKRETENSEAYQLYLQGRFYWNKYSDDGFRKSVGYFKDAIEKAPTYTLAYAGLADSYSLLGEMGMMHPHEAFPAARTYAEKAISLDDSLAEAHLSLGIVKLFYDWDLEGAGKELSRAKELDPLNAQIHHFYGHYLQFRGKPEEGRIEMGRAVELDPTNLIINTEAGLADHYMRRYDAAIAALKKTLDLDPTFTYASWGIAQAYEEKKMYQEAMEELNKAKTYDPNWVWIKSEMGCVLASLGRRSEAEAIIEELRKRSSSEYVDATLIAFIYIALGDKDQAFVWLEKGYQERAGNIPWIHLDPRYDKLQPDPRLADLIRRIGIAH